MEEPGTEKLRYVNEDGRIKFLTENVGKRAEQQGWWQEDVPNEEPLIGEPNAEAPEERQEEAQEVNTEAVNDTPEEATPEQAEEAINGKPVAIADEKQEPDITDIDELPSLRARYKELAKKEADKRWGEKRIQKEINKLTK